MGIRMISTIFLFSHFFKQSPSLRHSTNPPSPSIPDAPGAVPKEFPHLRNPGFLIWNAGLLECAVRVCRVKRPWPLTAHLPCLLTSCSCPSSPTPCMSPSSTLTPPPVSDPPLLLPGAQVGEETKTGFITRVEKQPETRAEGSG